jgi:hypothetical protein
MDTSDLMKRLMRSPALPGGVKVTLSAIEGQYARYVLVFPEDRFRDDDAFREYLSRVSSVLTDSLLNSVRGSVFNVELYNSSRPFTVYLVMECLPDDSVTASSSVESKFKFFNLSGTTKILRSGSALLSIHPGDPVGWKISGEDLELYLPVDSKAVSLGLTNEVLSWMESQDPSFRLAARSLRSVPKKGPPT